MALMKKKQKTPLGIYVHIPFCKSKCQYCDFYSLATKDDRLTEGYLDAVCAHIRETGPLAPGYIVDSIYFGGGTPSFLGADALATVLSAIRRNFDVAADAEITFEANPDSVTPRLLRRLHSEGFNRVSLGIQCDNDDILDKIGRPHNYAQAVEAVEKIRKAGFRNLSVDLMFGLPDQTLHAWEDTLRNVLELEPEHISCYGLTLEENTPMYRYREMMNLPDDDMQADMYLKAVELLRSKGYRQYEISNFSRRNHECRHNLKYWLGGEYIAFGPNGASDFAGKRFTAVRDLRGYIEGVLSRGQIMDEISEIPPRERAGDYLMLRLRTIRGIGQEEYERQYLLPFAPLEAHLEEYAKHGYCGKLENGHWRLTPEGFLISNTIIRELQEIQDAAAPLAKRR